jgi:hypothetical protein
MEAGEQSGAHKWQAPEQDCQFYAHLVEHNYDNLY